MGRKKYSKELKVRIAHCLIYGVHYTFLIRISLSRGPSSLTSWTSSDFPGFQATAAHVFIGFL